MSIEVRGANEDDALGVAQVHVASWQAAYRGIIDQPYLNARDVEEHRKRWSDRFQSEETASVTFVALNGEKIVGFSNIGPWRDEGMSGYAELYAIYLDPAYFGQSVGRKLFEMCLMMARRWEFEKLYVWVLKDNKLGCDFYERMGAVASGAEKEVIIGGKPYLEIRYDWEKLP